MNQMRSRRTWYLQLDYVHIHCVSFWLLFWISASEILYQIVLAWRWWTSGGDWEHHRPATAGPTHLGQNWGGLREKKGARPTERQSVSVWSLSLSLHTSPRPPPSIHLSSRPVRSSGPCRSPGTFRALWVTAWRRGPGSSTTWRTRRPPIWSGSTYPRSAWPWRTSSRS